MRDIALRPLFLAGLLTWATACGQLEAFEKPASSATDPEHSASLDSEPAWATAPRVFARAVSTSPVEVDPNRVLFLPLFQRTPHRIHPTALRGFDRALASYAAQFQGRSVVDPAVTWELGLLAGMPGRLAADNQKRPSKEQLTELAQRTGAGVVVWAELSGDGAFLAHAIATHPNADATPWADLEVTIPDLLRGGLYRGPGHVLRAVRNRTGSPPLTRQEPPPEARDRLAAALNLAWSGPAAATRSAELELADLAVQHPNWPGPLVELAALRLTRAFVFDHPYLQAWLGEGPLVPMHLAGLFSDLPEPSKNRLAAIDAILNAPEVSDPTRFAIIERLDAHDLLRAVHAAVDPGRAEGSFGLSKIQTSSPSAAWFLSQARFTGPELPEVEARFAEPLQPAQLVRNDALLGSLIRSAHTRNDWASIRTWSVAAIPGGVHRAIASTRGYCAAASESVARECDALLWAWLHEGQAEAARPVDPASPDAWDQAVLNWAGNLFAEEPTLPESRLPDLAIFDQDPTFALVWDASRELGRVVGEALALAEVDRGPSAGARDLLVSDPRHEIRRGREILSRAAFEPQRIAGGRGDFDRRLSYLEALVGLDRAVPATLHSWLRGSWYAGQKVELDQGYGQLIDSEVWHEDWLWTWIDKFGYGGRNTRNTARFLDLIHPKPHLAMRASGDAWQRIGNEARAFTILDHAVAKNPRADTFVAFDRATRDLDRPISTRLEPLERAILMYPGSADLRYILGARRMWATQYAASAEVLQPLVGHPKKHEDACNTLLDGAFGRGDHDAARQIASDCTDRAPDKWTKARGYILQGNLARLRGDPDSAMKAYAAGSALIGGAAYLVKAQASLAEAMGEFDAARKGHAFNAKQYGGTDALWRMAAVDLHEGRIDEARTALLEVAREKFLPTLGHRVLGRLLASVGDLDTFLEVSAGRPSASVSLALTAFTAWDLGDLQGGLKIIDEALREHPKDTSMRLLRGDILLALDRPEDATAEARLAMRQANANHDLFLLEIRGLAESGQLSEAREHLARFSSRWPASGVVQLGEFHIHKVEGDVASARAAIRSVWKRALGYIPADQWWMKAQFWLDDEISLGLDAVSPRDLAWLTEKAEAITQNRAWDAHAWTVLSTLQTAQGMTEEARTSMKTAARLGPLGEKSVQHVTSTLKPR